MKQRHRIVVVAAPIAICLFVSVATIPDTWAIGQDTCSGNPDCDKSAAFSEVSLERFCLRDAHPPSLAFWKNYANTVLSGTISEVRGQITSVWSNQCWARLDVAQFIKNSVGKEVWVTITYSPYVYPYTGKKKNYSDLRNCPVKMGSKYIVYGIYKPEIHVDAEATPVILSGYDDDPEGHCTPIIELKDDSKIRRQHNN